MPETATTSRPYDQIRPIAWEQDHLRLIDQRRLPAELLYRDYHRAADVAQAISDMVVRGAPAIGISAAYGVVLAARQHFQTAQGNWRQTIQGDLDHLAQARPTAVNLRWAVERMRNCITQLPEGDPVPALLALAEEIHAADIEANYRMGDLGAALIETGSGVLTHCNAGALATGGYGTALGVIRAAFGQGRIGAIYADETRPWLQGARLTAWELAHEGLPATVIADSAAAHLMKTGQVQWVIVGADRITANGDAANKIGTYSLAVNARYHGVKFMVAAPVSTIDMAMASGDLVPIETRSASEVLGCGGNNVAPADAVAWNPAFDVTPAALIDVIVTEKGVITQPTTEKMAQFFTD